MRTMSELFRSVKALEKKSLFLGSLMGAAVILLAGVLFPAAHPPERESIPIDPAPFAGDLSGSSALGVLTKKSEETEKTAPIQATPVSAGRVQPRLAAQGTPIPLPNVPNPSAIQSPAAAVSIVAPPAPTAPEQPEQLQEKAQAREAPRQGDSLVDEGRTFSDGRIAWFSGSPAPSVQDDGIAKEKERSEWH